MFTVCSTLDVTIAHNMTKKTAEPRKRQQLFSVSSELLNWVCTLEVAQKHLLLDQQPKSWSAE